MIKPPKIIREFHIERSPGFTLIYPFTCYVDVFEEGGGPNLMRLKKYFRSLLRNGTPDYKEKGSVSQQKVLLIEKELCQSDLTAYAFAADYDGKGEKQHETVQLHLHQHDIATVATEIPVWSTQEEIEREKEGRMVCQYCCRDREGCSDCGEEYCKKHTKCAHLLHGHIDVIRCLEGDIIEVADFKPHAEKETKAASQVWRYMSLLCMRTGINIKNITGVYFDSSYAYRLINK